MANNTVLIIEDRAADQLVLKQLLAKFEYSAEVCTSAEEALEQLQAREFAAIIMDLSLPGMSGFDATRQIREMEAKTGKRTPIVAVTASAREQDRLQCLQSGMDDYISKPFDPEELRRILLRWTYRPDNPNLKLLRH